MKEPKNYHNLFKLVVIAGLVVVFLLGLFPLIAKKTIRIVNAQSCSSQGECCGCHIKCDCVGGTCDCDLPTAFSCGGVQNGCPAATSTPQPTSALTPQPTSGVTQPPGGCSNPASCTQSSQCCPGSQCNTTDPGQPKNQCVPEVGCSPTKLDCRQGSCVTTCAYFCQDCSGLNACNYPCSDPCSTSCCCYDRCSSNADCVAVPLSPTPGTATTCAQDLPDSATCTASGGSWTSKTADKCLSVNGVNASCYADGCWNGRTDQATCLSISSNCRWTDPQTNTCFYCSCPAPTTVPTDTPPPTPTPYLRVRAADQLAIPVTVGELCKVNCTTSPCVSTVPCQSGSTWFFSGAEANRGGRIYASGNVVLGVTPYLNDVVNTTNGVSDPTCRKGVSTPGEACYYWTTGVNTGNRLALFIVATPTGTPPAATPTPGPWYKLNNASFNKRGNSFINQIPQNPSKFDATDTTDRWLIVGAGGVVNTSVDNLEINLGSYLPTPKTSKYNWRASSYSFSQSFYISQYIDYIKARKQYKSITNLTGITSPGIYMINSGNQTVIDSDNYFNHAPFVLIVQGGNVTLNTTASDTSFNYDPPIADKLVAILSTGTLNIPGAISEIHGVFAANSVNLNSDNIAAPHELKIVGNLLLQTDMVQYDLTKNPYPPFNRRAHITDPSFTYPTIYLVFDPQYYVALLPYLSTATYDWKQLQ